MNQIDHLREQIDACRPGSSDLELPALAELAQAALAGGDVAEELAKSKRLDRAIAVALQDVSVPPHLLERLLAAAGPSALDDAHAVPDPLPVALPAKPGRALISRRWILTGGSVALTLALGFVAYQGLRPPRVVKEQELRGAVENWLAELQPATWKPLAGDVYPQGYPGDFAVKARPQQWQALNFASRDGWSANVAAVDVAPVGSPRAVLFVVRSSARFMVPPVPATAKGLGLSQGMRAIAWQRLNSPWLYVLAVDEDRGQRLDDYLQKTHIARHVRRPAGQSL